MSAIVPRHERELKIKMVVCIVLSIFVVVVKHNQIGLINAWKKKYLMEKQSCVFS